MRLLELIGSNVLLLELLQSLGNLSLDSTSCAALDLGCHLGRRDGLFACVQVGLEVGSGFVAGGKVLVGVLEPERERLVGGFSKVR